MSELSIDIESRSRCDLLKQGLYTYARDPSTQVLLFCYALDDGPIHTWRPMTETMPPELANMLADTAVSKWAWNATFERELLKHVLKLNIPTWRDTMVCSMYASLPAALGLAGPALKLPDELTKNPEGKRLIRLFSLPNREGGFNDWRSHPDEFNAFDEYCQRDVEAERAIRRRLSKLRVPDSEWRLWELDQRINERGIPVDMEFVRAAKDMAALDKRRLLDDLIRMTGVPNPTTTSAFLAWAKSQGYPFGDLRKDTVTAAMTTELSPLLKWALKTRGLVSKTSTAKFDVIELSVAADERVHALHQFYGAPRTGRWAGRNVQHQNLPRPTPDIEGHEEEVTDLIKAGDYDEVLMRYGSAVSPIASVIRSAFRAPKGKTFYISDLNAIENRVLGWLAGCDAILDVFRHGRDPYKDFGTRMFHVPYEEITKPQRTMAKPAVLGCGYMLGGGQEVTNKNGDVVRTGLWGYASSMGVQMTKAEAQYSVRVFRESYGEVVEFWEALREAAFAAVASGGVHHVGALAFEGERGLLRMHLPSGRALHYIRPKIELRKREFIDDNQKKRIVESPTLCYDGPLPGSNKWGRLTTHPGKLAENATQAVARDVLAVGLMRADAAGFDIILHCHDEIVAEVPLGSARRPVDLANVMAAPIKWAKGLPLHAEAMETLIYRK